FGQMIILVVYLPIFALSGVEAKMFHPMAMTVVMALLGAMILSVTFVPAAVALFVTGEVKEKETRWMQLLKQKYQNILDQAYQLKIVVVS
ncbi:efflux RND transporter permease subunit, partial [Acinetobacter baumannii]